MTIKNFIDLAFNKIVITFPSVTVKYQFKEFSQTHVFKISPESIYKDTEYMKLEYSLDETFATIPTHESLLFISENPLVDVENPDRVASPYVFLDDCSVISSFVLSDGNTEFEETIQETNVSFSNLESSDIGNIVNVYPRYAMAA